MIKSYVLKGLRKFERKSLNCFDEWNGLRVTQTFFEKLGIGTVNFGIEYGPSSASGKVNSKEIQSILRLANDRGVGFIDTASLYGNSEEMLGRFLPKKNTFKVITKTLFWAGSEITFDFLKEARHAFLNSISLLGVEKMHGLLVHRSVDLLKPRGELFLDLLLEFKELGLVEKIGVSVYDPNELDCVLDKFIPDIVQIPFSIADQRFKASGQLKDLKSKGVEIHVRSVFLQGMLLLEPENLDPYFEPVLDFFQKLSLYSQEAGTSLLHTCLRFVLFQDEVDGVIVGVKSFKELNEILNTPNFSVPFKLPEPDTCINDTKFTYPLNWPMYN